jgi:hypothetical protein
MSANSSPALSAIHLSAFLRALIAPLLAWGAAVLFITVAGQPGVVCMTPMAWLLALWSGRQYVRLSNGQPDRLGPVLLGAVLGLGLGLIFALVSAQALPVDPSEVGKSQMLTAIMIVGGIVVCAAFSTFTARAMLRQYGERRS